MKAARPSLLLFVIVNGVYSIVSNMSLNLDRLEEHGRNFSHTEGKSKFADRLQIRNMGTVHMEKSTC